MNYELEVYFFNKFDYGELLTIKRGLIRLLNIKDDDNLKNLLGICCNTIVSILGESLYTYDVIDEKIKDQIIGSDRLNSLNYDELKLFNNIFYELQSNFNDPIYSYDFLLSQRFLEIKEDIVRSNIYRLEEMSMNEYAILISVSSYNNLEMYAIDCGVELEDLTKEVMYKRYHKEEKILKRS